MPGPGKKPTKLKAIAGTDRPDRAPENVVDLPLVHEIPSAPDWLPNAHAVKEWDRLTRILHANKLLTEAGLSTLGHLCALHGTMVQMYAAGVPITASLAGTYRNFANDFGVTPVAQGKVKAGDTGTAGNKFAKHGKRDA